MKVKDYIEQCRRRRLDALIEANAPAEVMSKIQSQVPHGLNKYGNHEITIVGDPTGSSQNAVWPMSFDAGQVEVVFMRVNPPFVPLFKGTECSAHHYLVLLDLDEIKPLVNFDPIKDVEKRSLVK